MTETYYKAISGTEEQQRISIPRPTVFNLQSHPGDYVKVELTLMKFESSEDGL